MKKLLLILVLVGLGYAAHAQRTVELYTYNLTANDTMLVYPSDKTFGVIISIPNWATDSTTVMGRVGTSEDGHNTEEWTVAHNENLNIVTTYIDCDTLIIIPSDKARIGLLKK